MLPYHVIIPARYDSSRLPGKPLKLIAGKPMIQWVYEAARLSRAQSVWVATDDDRIADAVKHFGGEVCMTRRDHPSGTDRLEEVVSQLNLPHDAIVVNVQGDEPLIPPEAINQVADLLAQAQSASMATLSEPIHSLEDAFNPNIVKVICNLAGQALYFSRAPIPWDRDGFGAPSMQWPPSLTLPSESLMQRHIGLYAYRVSLLHQFVRWPLAPIEITEKLEQLRVLFNGHQIQIAPACTQIPAGVDTQTDLERVRASMESLK